MSHLMIYPEEISPHNYTFPVYGILVFVESRWFICKKKMYKICFNKLLLGHSQC